MKQVLDRIFKEITGLRRVVKNDEDTEWNRAIYQCEEIVYKHMDDVPDADVFSWIPVEERLPEIPEENPFLENKLLELYLVDIGEKYPIRAFWNRSVFTDGWSILDVKAWMPLPEPYKERE